MKKTLLLALQLFLFCNIAFAKENNATENLNKYSKDFVNVVPLFDIQTTYCLGDTPNVLPTTSLNGVTGTWSPSVIDTSFSGSYVFTPDPGQDATNVTLTVTVNSPITSTFFPIGPFYLDDDVPQLPFVSNEGISGSWIPAVVDTSVGGFTTYTFIPNINECATPTSINIQVIPIANPVAPSPQTFNAGSTLADIVITPSNVLWYDTFNDAQADANRLPLSTPLVNNKTYYAVNDNGEYRSQPFPVTVNITLNTANFELKYLSFYPNPVAAFLTISTSFPIQALEVYNLLGQLVISENHNASEVTVNVTNLPNALYLVRIKSENQSKEFKIIKE
jgi:hypothetical protein